MKNQIIQLAENPSQNASVAKGRVGEGLRFREARVVVPDTITCHLKWKNYYGVQATARITDISRFGCRILANSESDSQKLFIKIDNALIEVDGLKAYSGPICFVNERIEPNGAISLGVTLQNQGCDLDVLSAAIGIKKLGIEDELARIVALSSNVGSEFKVLVADLNTLLQEAKDRMEIEDYKINQLNYNENQKYRLRERIITIALSIFGPQLQNVLSKFQSYAKELSRDEEIAHKQYFRLNFQNLVKGTPFVNRGIKKPLGYSGDYGMMVMLYEYLDIGDTLFHQFFHRFVCSEPAAVANKNRVGFLSDILIQGYIDAVKNGESEFLVTSLACGPAREIYEFLKFAPFTDTVKTKIILVDTEEHALDYAQARIKELGLNPKNIDVILLKEDVVIGVMQKKEFLRRIVHSNFIVCAGLFDYLTDRVSLRLISELQSLLKIGGQLIIGNISKRSPDAFAMDYFMDWRLILRDEADLLRLLSSDLQKSDEVVADVISEALGLNLFLRVRKIKNTRNEF